jgi:hypothetical protein
MVNIQKLKILFLGCMLTATLNAQKVSKEQSTIHQTVEIMFATLTNADTSALKNFVTSNVRFYEYGQVWNMDTLIQKVMQAKAIKDFIDSFVSLNNREPMESEIIDNLKEKMDITTIKKILENGRSLNVKTNAQNDENV